VFVVADGSKVCDRYRAQWYSRKERNVDYQPAYYGYDQESDPEYPGVAQKRQYLLHRLSD
jgi:hypothetical protein